ncbi:MAG: hypothetical protein GX552_04105, partial [Chloroflexi bacterium]|nr:hypothetical protein [Chloroflexota bacterium]
FRIIKTSQGGNPALVYMEKSGLGLWKIAYDGGEWTPDRQLASIVWIQDGGMKRYAVGQDPTFSFEWHTLYYGTNAAGPIAIDAQRLPPGVACNVQQAGTDFSVHLVSYESPETLGAADMYALIKDALNIQE